MILVTGATGNVGSQAARLLAARHQPVRAATATVSYLLLSRYVTAPGWV
jgi:uncharacterized protein YbjT (DUF2867 family)